MNTPSVPAITKTFYAGADLSALQYTFVKFGSADDTVIAASAAEEVTCGILMNAPASGELAEVALPGGGALLKMSGTVARGARLSTTSAGLGKAAAVINSTDVYVGAILHQSAVANDVAEVLVVASSLNKPSA